MWVGGAARRRLLEHALLVQAILRPVHDHGHGLNVDRIPGWLEVAVDRVVLVVGEVEGPVVDAAETFPLHHLEMPLLQMDVGLGVALATGELLAPGVDLMVDAEPAIATQHDAALELAERLEPAQPHGAGGLAIDIHDDVGGGIVVAVELLVVRAVLLAHEDGSAQRIALQQLVRCRCELDGHDGGQVGHRRLLRGHISSPLSILRSRSGSGAHPLPPPDHSPPTAPTLRSRPWASFPWPHAGWPWPNPCRGAGCATGKSNRTRRRCRAPSCRRDRCRASRADARRDAGA